MLDDQINLTGFRACNTNRGDAWKQSFQDLAKGKTSSLITVVCSSKNDWFIIDKPEYSPYSETETSVIVQDGLKMKVESIIKDKKQIKGKNSNVIKIQLRTVV